MRSFICLPDRSITGPRNSSFRDRLLGGLLSPDFDEPTCRSRYEGSKRWKPSPFPVSPYLVRKLREYEANHRRYREAMGQFESGRNGDRRECRYVVWLPIHGLGNRMLSLVSTFLYALLTGRVVLVHEPAEMEGLFCEPFPGTSWLLPLSGFPYMDRDLWSSSCQENYVTMLENSVVRYDDVGNVSTLPPYVYLHLESMNLRLQNHTVCEEDHRALDRFNWMVLRSDSYFAVALFLVPTYRNELGRMFPSKGSVFHHLGRYLLHPGNRAVGNSTKVLRRLPRRRRRASGCASTRGAAQPDPVRGHVRAHPQVHSGERPSAASDRRTSCRRGAGKQLGEGQDEGCAGGVPKGGVLR
jgi:xyloglucan fucosyltransferase